MTLPADSRVAPLGWVWAKKSRRNRDRMIVVAPAPIVGNELIPAPRRVWLPLSIGVLVYYAVMMFYGLGHYPLWEDEADTALYARSIARTGDTGAMLDHNLIAFRHGAALIGLHERYQPPLMFYVAAPFVGEQGTGTFWPRFPFALCGLAAVALLLYWLWRDGADSRLWVVFPLGLVLNVSLILYCRQCRYFSLGILETVAAAYCYLHWQSVRWSAVWLSALSLLFLLTNYFVFVGFWAAVGVDYFLFRRRTWKPTWSELLVVGVPQVLLLIYILVVRNPLGREVAMHVPNRDVLSDKLTLLWWGFREMNASEFGAGLLMLAAPLLYFVDRNIWLLRAFAAIVAYNVAVTLFSPQPVGGTAFADIRYLSALIPLCIYLTALAILTISRHRLVFAIPLALLAFGSSLLHYPTEPSQWRSTPCKWIGELYAARQSPIQMAADWINRNVAAGQSVWVMPEFMTYPLMYHASVGLYAWQLQPPPAEQFKELPPVHFIGSAPPNYIVAFGVTKRVDEWVKKLGDQGVRYSIVRAFEIHCNHGTRPELLLHWFDPVKPPVPDLQRVFVLQRSP